MSYPIDKLGNHIDILSGFAFKSKDFTETGVPVIKIKNVTPPYVSLESVSCVSNDIAEQQKKFQVHYNDVLIALTGSHINQMDSVVGRIAKVKFFEKAILNQRVGKIYTIDSNVCSLDYVYYFLSQEKVKIELASKAGGAANQANISTSDVKNLHIPFPKIEIQRRIANILLAYDNLIENNQKQIKLLEEAAQRLYKEWFVDLHFPGYENTPIVDGVPEGWAKCSMEDIADYINGYAFKPSDWGTVGKPIIKIKEMGNGITKDTPRNTGKNIPDKYFVSAGDILFSWSATLSAMIWDAEDGLLNQHLFKVIPYEDISREFVLQSILHTLDEFSNLTTGSTMKHIQRGKLQEVFVNVPGQDIMRKYMEQSDAVRNRILSLRKAIILLTEARDRLLPKLMSGELEV